LIAPSVARLFSYSSTRFCSKRRRMRRTDATSWFMSWPTGLDPATQRDISSPLSPTELRSPRCSPVQEPSGAKLTLVLEPWREASLAARKLLEACTERKADAIELLLDSRQHVGSTGELVIGGKPLHLCAHIRHSASSQ
jgi:hypothetical protein